MTCSACGYDDALYRAIGEKLKTLPVKTRREEKRNMVAVEALKEVQTETWGTFREVMNATGRGTQAVFACPRCRTMLWKD